MMRRNPENRKSEQARERRGKRDLRNLEIYNLGEKFELHFKEQKFQYVQCGTGIYSR